MGRDWWGLGWGSLHLLTAVEANGGDAGATWGTWDEEGVGGDCGRTGGRWGGGRGGLKVET